MNIPPNPLRDKRSFCQLFPSACMYERVHALAPDVWVRIHCQLEVSDLCIWFNATMMDDMVIRGLPIGLGPYYLAVKVNGYEARNRVATWWAHWNTSCVPWRHPSYLMSHSRESSVVGPQPREDQLNYSSMLILASNIWMDVMGWRAAWSWIELCMCFSCPGPETAAYERFDWVLF